MASEDFSYMLERVPGTYIQIGDGGAATASEDLNCSNCIDVLFPDCRPPLDARRS